MSTAESIEKSHHEAHGWLSQLASWLFISAWASSWDWAPCPSAHSLLGILLLFLCSTPVPHVCVFSLSLKKEKKNFLNHASTRSPFLLQSVYNLYQWRRNVYKIHLQYPSKDMKDGIGTETQHIDHCIDNNAKNSSASHFCCSLVKIWSVPYILVEWTGRWMNTWALALSRGCH